MSDGCDGTCSTCGDLCASAEREYRKAARAALEAERDRVTEQLAGMTRERDEACGRASALGLEWGRDQEQVENARVESDLNMAAAATLHNRLATLRGENKRLRAIALDTTDNIMAMAEIIAEAPTLEDGLIDAAAAARAVLIDQRLRAG